MGAIGYRLSAIGYRLSAIGYRLSAIGYRLSAIGYRLSARKVTGAAGMSKRKGRLFAGPPMADSR
jgi:hypothetical protein